MSKEYQYLQVQTAAQHINGGSPSRNSKRSYSHSHSNFNPHSQSHGPLKQTPLFELFATPLEVPELPSPSEWDDDDDDDDEDDEDNNSKEEDNHLDNINLIRQVSSYDEHDDNNDDDDDISYGTETDTDGEECSIDGHLEDWQRRYAIARLQDNYSHVHHNNQNQHQDENCIHSSGHDDAYNSNDQDDSDDDGGGDGDNDFQMKMVFDEDFFSEDEEEEFDFGMGTGEILRMHGYVPEDEQDQEQDQDQDQEQEQEQEQEHTFGDDHDCDNDDNSTSARSTSGSYTATADVDMDHDHFRYHPPNLATSSCKFSFEAYDSSCDFHEPLHTIYEDRELTNFSVTGDESELHEDCDADADGDDEYDDDDDDGDHGGEYEYDNDEEYDEDYEELFAIVEKSSSSLTFPAEEKEQQEDYCDHDHDDSYGYYSPTSPIQAELSLYTISEEPELEKKYDDDEYKNEKARRRRRQKALENRHTHRLQFPPLEDSPKDVSRIEPDHDDGMADLDLLILKLESSLEETGYSFQKTHKHVERQRPGAVAAAASTESTIGTSSISSSSSRSSSSTSSSSVSAVSTSSSKKKTSRSCKREANISRLHKHQDTPDCDVDVEQLVLSFGLSLVKLEDSLTW